jgi:fructose-1,6-bisphosphatase I
MPNRRTTFSKFIIEDQRRRTAPDRELTALLNDIQTACKFIASATSRGKLNLPAPPSAEGLAFPGEDDPKATADVADVADEIMLRESEWGGQLCGVVSAASAEPCVIPKVYPRGPYLLAFNALEGSSNLDIGLTAGTIFSVLRAPEGVTEATARDFMQPGTSQLAAGFALYGPTSTIVMTLGAGVHGFTLDREIGAYTLTEPDMRIGKETDQIAIDSSNQRFWEPPIGHYVEECVEGSAGPRKADFNLRWADSLAAETYRILVRGGVSIFPLDTSDASRSGRLRLLYEANPIAMIVEQADGSASTGRARILERTPIALHERVPMIFGARDEVARLVRYHETYDRGEGLSFETPLFNARSLFRAG